MSEISVCYLKIDSGSHIIKQWFRQKTCNKDNFQQNDVHSDDTEEKHI